jgi:hypothetical protein
LNVLTTDQKVRLSARYTDKYGNPASIDGPPRWELSAEGIVTLAPSADGLSADVVTVGPVGTVQVRAVADAVPGAEERLIIGVADIEVVGGEARVVTLTAGAAESKPDNEAPPFARAPTSPGGETPAPAAEPTVPDTDLG